MRITIKELRLLIREAIFARALYEGPPGASLVDPRSEGETGAPGGTSGTGTVGGEEASTPEPGEARDETTGGPSPDQATGEELTAV